MMLWSETEFDRVSKGTRLSIRSLNACRDVLVNGVSPGIAAREHKMFAAAVSRSLGLLREKQAEIQLGAQAYIENNMNLKIAAELVARALMGTGAMLFDPSPGQNYEGQVLAVQHGFAIQKIGMFAALHDLGVLPELPKVGDKVSITYPRDGGRPVMVDLTKKGVRSEIGR
jgi:hypothetical protein